MTELVDPEHIEKIVGHRRHGTLHLGRADSSSQTMFILHSRACWSRVGAEWDLRDCEFSQALDRGIRAVEWSGREDVPVVLRIHENRLRPEDLEHYFTPAERAANFVPARGTGR